MSEHLKAIPDPKTGLLRFEMDAAGLALIEFLLSRSKPLKTDNPAAFQAVHDRVSGACMAGGYQLGWSRKK